MTTRGYLGTMTVIKTALNALSRVKGGAGLVKAGSRPGHIIVEYVKGRNHIHHISVCLMITELCINQMRPKDGPPLPLDL